MSNQATHRAVLAGAAALSALAVPAAAAPEGFVAVADDSGKLWFKADADPIFAAIYAHRAAYEKMERARYAETAKRHEVDTANFASGERSPSALVAWRKYSHIGGGEIERAREEFLRDGIDPRTVECEYKQVRAKYEELLGEERAYAERVGLAPLEDAEMEAREAHDMAARALTTVQPMTIEGVRALLAHIVAFNKGEYSIAEDWKSNAMYWPGDEEDEFASAVMENAARALAGLTA